jgi:hypothetical protein
MKKCLFLDNSEICLTQEIKVGNLTIPINSDELVAYPHLGIKHLVQARCRICPYNFECECAYPSTNSYAEPLKLLGWIITSWRKGSIETAYNALDKVRAKIGSITPDWLTILMICPFQTTFGELEDIQNAVIKELSLDTKVSFAFDEVVEDEEIIIVVCLWIKG